MEICQVFTIFTKVAKPLGNLSYYREKSPVSEPLPRTWPSIAFPISLRVTGARSAEYGIKGKEIEVVVMGLSLAGGRGRRTPSCHSCSCRAGSRPSAPVFSGPLS